jgi:hypothetical protein
MKRDRLLAEAGVTIPADVTVLVPDGAKLTGTLTGAGTVSVEAGGTATGLPTLSTGKIVTTTYDPNPVDLKVTVASKKYLATGNIDITLKGTVTGGITTAGAAIWGNQAASGAPKISDFSWVVLNNLLPAPVNGAIEIKQTNDSFRYYTGLYNYPNNHATTTLITAAQESDPYICIPSTGTPCKWKKYIISDGSGQPADTTDNGFGVLLWSGASSKTATIEVDRAVIGSAAAVKYTVTVDWSGVTIN